MGANLVNSIRADPTQKALMRQIVGGGKITSSIGTIEGERKPDIGGCAQPQSTGGDREIMVDNSIAQNSTIETAMNFVDPNLLSSTNNDHQYFSSSNVFTNPASPSSLLFSSVSSSSSSTSNNESFDFESLLQQPSENVSINDNNLFSTNDTAVEFQYDFMNNSYPPQIDIINSTTTNNSSNTIIKANSPNSSVVPASPSTLLNFDTDFPQLGDDILEIALKSLGDFTKNNSDLTNSSSAILPTLLIDNQNASTSGYDFLQQDDYTDPAWEESFAQLFPSLSNS